MVTSVLLCFARCGNSSRFASGCPKRRPSYRGSTGAPPKPSDIPTSATRSSAATTAATAVRVVAGRLNLARCLLGRKASHRRRCRCCHCRLRRPTSFKLGEHWPCPWETAAASSRLPVVTKVARPYPVEKIRKTRKDDSSTVAAALPLPLRTAESGSILRHTSKTRPPGTGKGEPCPRKVLVRKVSETILTAAAAVAAALVRVWARQQPMSQVEPFGVAVRPACRAAAEA